MLPVRFPRHLRRRLSLLSLGLLVIAFGTVGVVTLALMDYHRAQPPRSWGDETFSQRWETEFDRASPLRPTAIDLWTSIRYALFGQGLKGVLVGRDGWLFTDEEWRQVPANGPRFALDQIAQVRNTLRQRQIELLVAIVPAKNRVVPDLSPVPVSAALARRYAQALQELTARGVLTVDLAAALGSGSEGRRWFMRTDTHWSPAGARRAAQAIGQQVRDLGLVRDQEARAFHSVPAAVRPEFRGDLFEFLPSPSGLVRTLGGFRPLPGAEILRPETTEPVTQAALGLFDTPQIAVAVVGTSYSAAAAWNFAGYLQEALSLDVMNLALEGRGPFEPMDQALVNPALTEMGVRLVIWEIPERYLPAR